MTSASITEEDQNGAMVAYYEVQGSVQVTEDALALRFAAPTPDQGE